MAVPRRAGARPSRSPRRPGGRAGTARRARRRPPRPPACCCDACGRRMRPFPPPPSVLLVVSCLAASRTCELRTCDKLTRNRTSVGGFWNCNPERDPKSNDGQRKGWRPSFPSPFQIPIDQPRSLLSALFISLQNLLLVLFLVLFARFARVARPSAAAGCPSVPLRGNIG